MSKCNFHDHCYESKCRTKGTQNPWCYVKPSSKGLCKFEGKDNRKFGNKSGRQWSYQPCKNFNKCNYKDHCYEGKCRTKGEKNPWCYVKPNSKNICKFEGKLNRKFGNNAGKQWSFHPCKTWNKDEKAKRAVARRKADDKAKKKAAREAKKKAAARRAADEKAARRAAARRAADEKAARRAEERKRIEAEKKEKAIRAEQARRKADDGFELLNINNINEALQLKGFNRKYEFHKMSDEMISSTKIKNKRIKKILANRLKKWKKKRFDVNSPIMLVQKTIGQQKYYILQFWGNHKSEKGQNPHIEYILDSGSKHKRINPIYKNKKIFMVLDKSVLSGSYVFRSNNILNIYYNNKSKQVKFEFEDYNLFSKVTRKYYVFYKLKKGLKKIDKSVMDKISPEIEKQNFQRYYNDLTSDKSNHIKKCVNVNSTFNGATYSKAMDKKIWKECKKIKRRRGERRKELRNRKIDCYNKKSGWKNVPISIERMKGLCDQYKTKCSNRPTNGMGCLEDHYNLAYASKVSGCCKLAYDKEGTFKKVFQEKLDSCTNNYDCKDKLCKKLDKNMCKKASNYGIKYKDSGEIYQDIKCGYITKEELLFTDANIQADKCRSNHIIKLVKER